MAFHLHASDEYTMSLYGVNTPMDNTDETDKTYQVWEYFCIDIFLCWVRSKLKT